MPTKFVRKHERYSFRQPFHIFSTTTGDILEPGINTFPLQGFGVGVGFQVLNLRPDPRLGRGERIALHSVGRHTHTTEVVLIQGDGGTGKGKIPGFKARLGEGHVTPDPFSGPFRQVQESHIQNGLWDIGVFALDIGHQLAHSGFCGAGNAWYSPPRWKCPEGPSDSLPQAV